MRKSILVLGSTLMITTLIALVLLLSHQKANHLITSGMMDASDATYEDIPVISLDGDWRFYPYRFYTPQQLQNNAGKGVLIEVPDTWNSELETGAYGFGTYELTLKLPAGHTYALGLKSIYTAYTLFINGKAVRQIGTPAAEKEQYTPEFQPGVVSFYAPTDTTHIVFHVSNFDHAKGGLAQRIILGRPDEVSRVFSLEMGITMFLVGMLVLTGLFMISFFGSENNNSGLVYFAAFCLLIALRATLDGTIPFIQLLNFVPYTLQMKLEYLTNSVGLLCFVLYSQRAFSYAFGRISSAVTVGTAGVYAILIILTPVGVFSSLLSPFGAVIAVYGLFWIFRMARGWLKERSHSIIPLAGGMVLMLTVLNDLVFYTQVNVSFPFLAIDLIPIGLLFFVLSHSFEFSLQYLTALKTARHLTEKLEYEVEQRTAELKELNVRLLNMATNDELTGVHNRTALEQQSEKVQASGVSQTYSVLYTDLDNFKFYNDTFSHDAGDMILVEYTHLLNRLCRQFGTAENRVFRMGGDEFVLLLPGSGSVRAQECARHILSSMDELNARISAELGKSHPAQGQRIPITCSVGIATQSSRSVNIDQLIRQADKALIEAKSHGKNRYLQYTQA
jgi:diguanylate cyclase (GGDEF)-like protein